MFRSCVSFAWAFVSPNCIKIWSSAILFLRSTALLNLVMFPTSSRCNCKNGSARTLQTTNFVLQQKMQHKNKQTRQTGRKQRKPGVRLFPHPRPLGLSSLTKCFAAILLSCSRWRCRSSPHTWLCCAVGALAPVTESHEHMSLFGLSLPPKGFLTLDYLKFCCNICKTNMQQQKNVKFCKYKILQTQKNLR